jgi:hypothetical protein
MSPPPTTAEQIDPIRLVTALDADYGVVDSGVHEPQVRGLPAYSALQLRVADEVRDRRRPNPYAAMVRLSVRLEAVR